MTALHKPFIGTRNRLDFLRDGKGIYGLVAPDEPWKDDSEKVFYILHPDRIQETKCGLAALQTVSKRPLFKHFKEFQIAHNVAGVLHRKSGLHGDWMTGNEWWATTDEGRAANRRKYHGQTARAFRVVNSWVGRVLEEAADKVALRAARRFRLKDREAVYRAAALSPRALQLTDTFPVLAQAIYASGHYQDMGPEAHQMVESGAPLKSIAAQVGIPLAFRYVKPGAAYNAISCLKTLENQDDLISAYLPKTLPAQRRWFRAINYISEFGPPAVEWTARNAAKLPGRTINSVLGPLSNISDWVKASYRSSVPHHVLRVVAEIRYYRAGVGSEFITRQFSPDMSLATVMQLSDDWHEAIADSGMSGENHKFPEPWLPAATVNGYGITPITTAAELYLEGNKMRHCVSTYSSQVMDGDTYVYSVTQDEKKVATAALEWTGKRYGLSQVAGPCNAITTEECLKALRRWIRDNKDIPAPKRPKGDDCDPFSCAPPVQPEDDDLDSIPF